MRARRLLDEAEGVLTLAELSKRVGVSPFHLQRLFNRATGLSPREYQSARRMQQVKHGLRKGDDVTFRWRDSAHGNKKRLMTLPVEEFLRRFLLHLLPKGFRAHPQLRLPRQPATRYPPAALLSTAR
jgi:AraC-like DNA-binding protein